MLPDQAVTVQRYVIRDGQPFDEADYRRRHREGVVQLALAGGGVPSEVLEALDIDLSKERKAVSTTKTKTDKKPNSRVIEAVAKDDRVWREKPAGTEVKLYTAYNYDGMIDIFIRGEGNLARKPSLKVALEYCNERKYAVVGVSRLLASSKLLKGRFDPTGKPKAEATPKKAEAAPKKAAKKAAKPKAAPKKKAAKKAAPKPKANAKTRATAAKMNAAKKAAPKPKRAGAVKKVVRRKKTAV